MSYATTHARASATLARKGAAVTFTQVSPGVPDPETGVYTGGSTTTITGDAVRVYPTTAADMQRYAALGLVQSEAASLFFTPDTYGSLPALGFSVTWGGIVYTVRDVDPLAPDGTAIAATVIVSK